MSDLQKLTQFADLNTQLLWSAHHDLFASSSPSAEDHDKKLYHTAFTCLRQTDRIQHLRELWNQVYSEVIPDAVRSLQPVIIYSGTKIHRIRFLDLLYAPPTTTKQQAHTTFECRLTSASYECHCILRIHHQVYTRDIGKEKASGIAPGASEPSSSSSSSSVTMPSSAVASAFAFQRRVGKIPEELWGKMVSEEVLEFTKGRMCILLGSMLCWMRMGHPEAVIREPEYQVGGMFCCNGNTRFSPTTIEFRPNTILMHHGASALKSVLVKARQMTHRKVDGEDESVKADTSRRNSAHLHRKMCIEVRCRHETRPSRSTSTMYLFLNQSALPIEQQPFGPWSTTVYIQYVEDELPVSVVLWALGMDIEEQKQAMAVLLDGAKSSVDAILDSVWMHHDHMVRCQRDALLAIAKASHKANLTEDKQITHAHTTLRNEVAAHISVDPMAHYLTKAWYLLFCQAHMLKRFRRQTVDPTLICDSPDDFRLRSLENGARFSSLFRQLFRKYVIQPIEKQFTMAPDQATPAWGHMVQWSRMSKVLRQCLATGNFSVNRHAKNQQTNAVLLLTEHSEQAYLSASRRYRSKLNSQSNSMEPRMPDVASVGYQCIAGTPDSKNCGLDGDLALYYESSTYASSEPLRHLLEMDADRFPLALHFIPIRALSSAAVKRGDLTNTTKMFIDGAPWGFTRSPHNWVRHVRKLRRTFQISPSVSVIWTFGPSDKELWIQNTAHRPTRPLLNLIAYADYKGTDFSFPTLFRHGVVEKVSPEEMMTLSIAQSFVDLHSRCKKEPFSHVDFPCSVYGITAAMSPASAHDQYPRVLFQRGQETQALTAQEQPYSLLGSHHSLIMSEQPMVGANLVVDGLQLTNRGRGVNASMILYPRLQNIDDAVDVSASFIERNALASIHTRTHQCVHDTGKSTRSISQMQRPNPKDCVGLRSDGPMTHLRENGLPTIRAPIRPGQIVFGKTLTVLRGAGGVTQKERAAECASAAKSDASVYLSGNETMRTRWISRTEYQPHDMCTNEPDKVYYRATLSCIRISARGDKGSSGHGQKGVLSGVTPQEDLPFAIQRHVPLPDVIINPHCMPSRMTDGMMREIVMGNAATMLGHRLDGTSFSVALPSEDDDTIETLIITLGKMTPSCAVKYMSGTTGEPISCVLFTGPVYYQKLKQMIKDKGHERSIGPRHMETRQPISGRKKCGGVRLGLMEIAMLFASGADHMCIQRLLECAGSVTMHVCEHCHYPFCVHYPKYGFSECLRCKRCDGVWPRRVPYCTKLFFQEAQALGITPSMEISVPDELRPPKPKTMTAESLQEMRKIMETAKTEPSNVPLVNYTSLHPRPYSLVWENGPSSVSSAASAAAARRTKRARAEESKSG